MNDWRLEVVGEKWLVTIMADPALQNIRRFLKSFQQRSHAEVLARYVCDIQLTAVDMFEFVVHHEQIKVALSSARCSNNREFLYFWALNIVDVIGSCVTFIPLSTSL